MKRSRGVGLIRRKFTHHIHLFTYVGETEHKSYMNMGLVFEVVPRYVYKGRFWETHHYRGNSLKFM